MDFVVRFPVRNHTIFGGVPLTMFKSTKSESNSYYGKTVFSGVVKYSKV